MWESDIEILHAGQIRQFHILEHGKRLRYLDVMGLWLSTAGLGVYWLHLRLDSRPKYYSFQAYRDSRSLSARLLESRLSPLR